MSREEDVAVEPVRLPPLVERPEDVGSSTQPSLDAQACADERLDPDCRGEAAGLTQVEVVAAKEARDVDDP